MVADMRIAEKAVKSLWRDRMDVIEHQKVARPNKTTGFEDVKVITDEPCKIIFKTVESTDRQEAAALIQSIRLLCDKGFKVKPGSKIVVLHEGVETDYKQSGPPAVYSVHQEIMLEGFDRWA